MQQVLQDQMVVMARMVQMEKQLVMHLQQQDLQARKVRKVQQVPQVLKVPQVQPARREQLVPQVPQVRQVQPAQQALEVEHLGPLVQRERQD